MYHTRILNEPIAVSQHETVSSRYLESDTMLGKTAKWSNCRPNRMCIISLAETDDVDKGGPWTGRYPPIVVDSLANNYERNE